MLVVSWNVEAITGASSSRLLAIVDRIASVEPDLVLLQEVGNQVAARLAVELAEAGLRSFFGGVPGTYTKAYGNLIAARSALVGSEPRWSKAPWGQLLTRARVTLNGADVEVIAAHMPNGSDGWKKVETFEAL